jgi:amidophosphoribosyltransferase
LSIISDHMSEAIKHECGIAMIRLLKPLEYYQEKYGTWKYGLQKLYLLMEKQHNRGQDGAGVASVKFDVSPGKKYFHRSRSNGMNPIKEVFDEINKRQEAAGICPEGVNCADWAKENVDFAGELFMGHLRYGTFGRNSIENCHPVMRENNWRSRNLVVAGNFNLTNVSELFSTLIDLGQQPNNYNDTVTILEKIGHFLDRENQTEFENYKNQGLSNREISDKICKTLNVSKILQESCKRWDGGYVIGGMIGHGDAFIMRDPWGIRPCYYYIDDEVMVAASERPVIQTVMNVLSSDVKELPPGKGLIVKKDGRISLEEIRVAQEKKSCSFERIYFSRGGDEAIYRERKKLGENLVPELLKMVDHDVDNTVFSFIPNTAEVAFFGMNEGLEKYLYEEKKALLMDKKNPIEEKQLDKLLKRKPRIEKIAIKDIKLRTFIAQDDGRDNMVAHVYDVTYGVIRKGIDNLVIIDDSIVRGTTLKQSILKMLDRLGPKKIVVVSSAPQIRYPDCYGIDMAKLGDFIAFQAAISLLKETGRQSVIDEVFRKCKEQENAPKEEVLNHVKEIYAPFTDEEISARIGILLKPVDMKAEVEILYQSIEGLHKACPDDKGDWYFSGDYPTPGGNKVVNTAFINYVEKNNKRAY